MTRLLPPLLRALHTDEFAPVEPHAALAGAIGATEAALPDLARAVGTDVAAFAHDRRATAIALRAIDEAHGGGFYAVPAEATREQAGVGQQRERTGHGVVDVQTHLVDSSLWVGPHAKALGGFLQLVDPD